jgi:hypothetical protein
LYPTISQNFTLGPGLFCKYYGLTVTGGFSPNDNTLIPSLSIIPDSLNPQPIDFTTYIRWIENPFIDIYCYPVCTYHMNFAFQNINGDIVSNKEFSITIDNSQVPIEITPFGILDLNCLSIFPPKRNIPSEDIHFEQKVIVDPNPTSGKANVRLNLDQEINGRLVLYTATGEFVKEICNGRLPSGCSNYEIDLSSQPSGMYIITIESDGMQYIKKFVKE